MLFSKSALKPRHQTSNVVVLTDEAVRALFRRATILLDDGILPVEGKVIGWTRHQPTGLLNGVVLNELTGARFLYGPDLAKRGRALRRIAKLA